MAPAHTLRTVRRRVRGEAGFTLIEVLVTVLVLVVGLLGAFATLRASAHTTLNNRERQAETSLAREVLEDAGSLPASQLTNANLPAALQSLNLDARTVAADSLEGVRRGGVQYDATVSACSVDDPSDGYGAHNNPAQWCSNPTPSSPPDLTPEDEEQVSVIVQPSSAPPSASCPTASPDACVQQSTLIVNRPPAVKSLSPPGSCTGDPQISCAGGQTLTFSATTTAPATTSPPSYRWFVNGDLQPGATSSSFSWPAPSGIASYTISAEAQYGQGPWSPASTLQISITS